MGVNIDDMQIHVLTTLVKSFLRELSDPIMSYDLYENFLNVSGESVVSISRAAKHEVSFSRSGRCGGANSMSHRNGRSSSQTQQMCTR